jgi:hypothetical protein
MAESSSGICFTGIDQGGTVPEEGTSSLKKGRDYKSIPQRPGEVLKGHRSQHVSEHVGIMKWLGKEAFPDNPKKKDSNGDGVSQFIVFKVSVELI